MNISDILHKLRHKRPSFRQISDLVSRLWAYRYGDPGNVPSPSRIFINLNSRCNAKCAQCDVGQAEEQSLFYRTMVGEGSGELSPETLERLFTELAPFRPLIAFNGVEPTLYRELPSVIRSAGSKGMATQVTTNGILLPKLAESLVEAGLDTLWVSLDGPPETHDDIRGIPGAFHKAMEGMKELQAIKSRTGAKKPSINVVTTVFHRNQSEVCRLMRLLGQSGVGIDEVMVQHLQFITAGQAATHNRCFPSLPVTAISTEHSDPGRVDIERLREEVRKTGSAPPKLNIRWKPYLRTAGELGRYYRSPETFIGDGKCRVFWNELQILGNGTVTGSQRCFAANLGNVNETPFMEIWNGPAMAAWRALLKREGAFPACSRCCSIL